MKSIEQTECQHCGFKDQRALAFHHRKPENKSFSIKYGFSHHYSFATLLKECKKCDVLCVNCHIRHHYSNRIYRDKYAKNYAFRRKQIKQHLFEAIKQTSCQKCEHKTLESLSFHHREPKIKSFEITAMLTKKEFKSLLKEAKKCDILCMNCHFIHEYKLNH